MSVAAPPQPPLLRASAVHDPSEALIKEAKQRARRRRRIYGGAAAVVAIAGLAAFSAFGGTSATRGAGREVSPRPRPVAPLVQGPDDASTLLASWGQWHVGWAFVYADGRVVWSPDVGVFLDADGRVTGIGNGCCSHSDARPRSEYVAVERSLSPRGVELVRAGKLHPRRFLVLRDVDREGGIFIHFGSIERKGLWAEPTARVYEPSKYALCPTSAIPGEGPLAATDVVAELPAPAQALLKGKLRTFDPSIGTASWPRPSTAPPPDNTPVECFEITTAEASTLYQMLDANGQIFNKGHPNPQGWDGVLVSGRVELSPVPIYPHGQFFVMGG